MSIVGADSGLPSTFSNTPRRLITSRRASSRSYHWFVRHFIASGRSCGLVAATLPCSILLYSSHFGAVHSFQKHKIIHFVSVDI